MQTLETAVRYGLYPFLLLFTSFMVWNAFSKHYDLVGAMLWIAAGRFALLQSVELLLPLRKDWGVNLPNFGRDIKYGVANFLTMRLYGFIVGLMTIKLAAPNDGLIKGAPLLVEIIAAALMYEFFQYWFHRLSHEGKGWLGNKLWKIHVAHHLPDRVYLVMHGVAHPINTLIVMMIVPLTTWLTGVSPEAVMVWFAFRGLHGLISHFNVDIRAGWFNYIFVGTELHRYHHSANMDECKNYGSLLPIWDQIFGTFVYRPGINPERLGVEVPALYPASNDFFRVMALPFQTPSLGTAPKTLKEQSLKSARQDI